MLRLVSDENFDGDILRGLYRRCPELDVVRVRDVGLRGATDPDVFAWAALEGRILLTHDRDTMPNFAYDLLPVGQAIDEILLAVECLPPEECKDLVRFFPL